MTITTQITEVVSGATITITTNSVLRGPPGVVTPALQELADEAASSANSALASQQASSQSEGAATIAAQDAAASAVEAQGLAASVVTLREDLDDLTDPAKGVALIPTAPGLVASESIIRGRNNVNTSFLAQSPAGNPDSVAEYIKTGTVSITKAGVYEPPYIYDASGNEYIEKRPISFQHVPQIITDESPKLIVNSPFVAGQIVVAIKKAAGGYVLCGLANNITTNAADSLATSGSDPTMRRIVNVQSAVSVVVGNIGTPTVSGAWTSPQLNSVLPEIPAFTSGSNYVYRSTTVQNASLTYSLMSAVNGFINLSFLCSAGSTPIATISVDGVVTTLNMSSAITKIRTFRFPTYKDSVQVIITNAYISGTPSLNFIGQDFSTLALWKGAPIDTFGYYRNSALADYVISNSENDYTMKEYVTQIYGGGYHGGESAITDTFFVDGIAYTPTATPKVGNKLSISSTCNISWAPVGSSSSVSARKNYEFAVGGYYCSVSISGNIVLAELYSALFGANQAFDNIDVPSPKNINASIPNNQRLTLGRSTKVVMRNSSTGQTISASYTVHQLDSASQYGGVYVWRVDGTYNKLYYNVAHGGRLAIDGSFSTTKYEFP